MLPRVPKLSRDTDDVTGSHAAALQSPLMRVRAACPANNLLRAHSGPFALASGSLEDVIRENAVVSRSAPGSKESKQHFVVCGIELVVSINYTRF